MISNVAEQELDQKTLLEDVQKQLETCQSAFSESLIVKDPKVTNFPTSEKISTYLFAFVAGPFGFFERKTEGLPLLRIYARKSVMESVNH